MLFTGPLDDCSHDYNQDHATYDRSHARWLRFAGGEAQCAFEGAVSALLRPGMSMLDVACGTGALARRLQSSAGGAFQLSLLDASHRMLERCQDITARRVLGRMEAMPFQSDSFDVVTCAWGLETVGNPSLALAEFLRVVRPGGAVCLVFCADRPARSIWNWFARQHVETTSRGRFLDCEEVLAMVRSLGAQSVQVLHSTGSAAALIVRA